MPTIRIEHPIHDYATWKAAFDRDPVDRKGSGVRHYAIHRPLDDPRYVMVDLHLDEVVDAEALLGRLHQMWRSAAAAPALAGEPRARIVDTTEVVEL